MNTSMKELNLEEMEMVNGGNNWFSTCLGGFAGGCIGIAAAGLACVAMATPRRLGDCRYCCRRSNCRDSRRRHARSHRG